MAVDYLDLAWCVVAAAVALVRILTLRRTEP